MVETVKVFMAVLFIVCTFMLERTGRMTGLDCVVLGLFSGFLWLCMLEVI